MHNTIQADKCCWYSAPFGLVPQGDAAGCRNAGKCEIDPIAIGVSPSDEELALANRLRSLNMSTPANPMYCDKNDTLKVICKSTKEFDFDHSGQVSPVSKAVRHSQADMQTVQVQWCSNRVSCFVSFVLFRPHVVPPWIDYIGGESYAKLTRKCVYCMRGCFMMHCLARKRPRWPTLQSTRGLPTSAYDCFLAHLTTVVPRCRHPYICPSTHLKKQVPVAHGMV